MTAQRTRVKICGIMDEQTALHCASEGVDALGFVFVQGSPRYVSPEIAATIARALPPFVSTVALVMDQSESDVRQIVEQFKPDYLQFHGTESNEFCLQFGLPFIKSVPMGGGVDPLVFASSYPTAAAVLVDSNAVGESGGSGHAFDWSAMPAFTQPVMLAGGLTPENVSSAIHAVRPFAVDVSSGVEKSRGVKDLSKISLFVKGASSDR